jgi:hypothetical protein
MKNPASAGFFCCLARREKSFTAKDAKGTKEKKSPTAKDAKGAKVTIIGRSRARPATAIGRSRARPATAFRPSLDTART